MAWAKETFIAAVLPSPIDTAAKPAPHSPAPVGAMRVGVEV